MAFSGALSDCVVRKDAQARSGSGFSYFDIFQLQGGCFSEADRQPTPGLNPNLTGINP